MRNYQKSYDMASDTKTDHVTSAHMETFEYFLHYKYRVIGFLSDQVKLSLGFI